MMRSSPLLVLLVTAIGLAAITVVVFANAEIANAQQEEDDDITTISEGTTTFESIVDGFRLQVPNGWVIEDIDNTNFTLRRAEAELGYALIANICPQEQALSVIGGGGTYDCEQPPDNVYMMRFSDLRDWPAFASARNDNITTLDFLSFYIQEFMQGAVGVRNIETVNNIDTTVNLTSAQINQTIKTIPAKLVEFTYRTAPIADDDNDRGIEMRQFGLLVLNGTTGYNLFYERPAFLLTSGQLPAPVQQIFESFELVTANATTRATIAPIPTSTTSDAANITTSANATTTSTISNMTLEAAKEQYLTVWNQTVFNIAFSTYVEPGSAAAYGIYEEHDNNNNIFRPGETIVLYIEPVAFGHRQILDDQGNTQYLMNFTADFLIADANGNELLTFEDVPLGSIVSYRQNTELFLELTITQDQPFPVGDYIITYIIHDQVSGESLEIDKRITIADDNATISSAGLS
jgi:hypothetical protein